jgi:hypothetical protein
MGRITCSSKCGDFDLRDMHVEKRLPFKRDAVQKEIYVIDRNGHVSKGRAWDVENRGAVPWT